MIAHEFDYRRPTSLAEVTALLHQNDGTARLLAGGTDLVAWMRDDAIAPDLVIDLKGLPDLGDIVVSDGMLTIGSLVTFTELIESEAIRDHAPLLVEMAETVASPGIRNRATLAGNICSAVPSCDAGPVLLAYEARVHLVGPGGERTVPVDEWFVGPRLTARTDDEVVTRLDLRLGSHAGCYVKLMRYGGEDLAQASVGIVIRPGYDYRVAFGAVAPTPVRSGRIEAALAGRPIDDTALSEVVGMVRDEIRPITDIRASAEYRAHMCEVMLERGLRAAAERLAGSGPPYGTRLI